MKKTKEGEDERIKRGRTKKKKKTEEERRRRRIQKKKDERRNSRRRRRRRGIAEALNSICESNYLGWPV